MRVTAVLLALSGALLVAYGWWGVNTVAGRRRYDEMAGMIPFGLGVLSALLLAAGVVVALIAVLKARRGRRPAR